MFSSCFVIVPSLPFRSVIHFEFIFMYGVWKCYNFILLHVVFPEPVIVEAVFIPIVHSCLFCQK